ncbi:MAG: nitrous oxide reductase family maturation protein NosD [Chloroflexi bacterium]|nr:nitrous oxide reductase family maturation protein NosD [Chloroflexota bacterium]
MRRLAAALLLIALLVAGAQTAHAQARLVVSAQGPYTAIQAALADARDGDTIEVRGGTYAGPVVVERRVELLGIDWPVIDGGGRDTVVKLAADGAMLRGFVVRGSGVEPDRDDSGITVTADGVTIEGNRLDDVLFGVFLSKAADAVVRGNEISSKAQYDTGRKGDAVRVWYSPRGLIERNHIHDARDVVLWYASDIIVRDNLIERGRYGVHLMYSNNAHVERNRVIGNSIGIFAMYSKDLVLQANLLRGQRGPSGYALGFKDADGLAVLDNVLVDNRAGFFLDGTPFTPQSPSRFRGNIVAFNDIGAILLPAVKGNLFEGNTFWENIEQVGVQGGGRLAANLWDGNYWSDYGGLDVNGDGLGEAPYHSDRLFDGLMDREPMLRALLYSPTVQALEMAATTFPIVRPEPKLVDARPRALPAAIPPDAIATATNPAATAAAGALLMSLGILTGVLALPRWRAASGATTMQAYAASSDANAAAAIQVAARAVGKRYGAVRVLEGVSFDVRTGEALALWGANGAGKTTLIKAILGLIDFDGAITVAGRDVKRAGKQARRALGYVPQEAAFNDWSVQQTLEFYARLKRVATARRIGALLDRMGLREHAAKPVSALSGGLKQRLALAVALLADPPLLLLDEPTSNLDKQARADYLALLAELRAEGKTIVFTSHRFEEVEGLADRVLVLDQGVLAEIVTPEELRARWMPEVEVTLWVGEAQRAEALAALQAAGLAAHLNGRGTIVCSVPAGEKMRPFETLAACGVHVANFEVERGRAWS